VIHRVYSTLASFKELEFHPGLNVLAADKTRESSDTQTRNGAGKSSLIEIIHFLLGSNVPKDSMFRGSELRNEEFGMDIDLPALMKVRRKAAEPSRVVVSGLDDSLRGPSSELFAQENEKLRLEDWREYLGKQMFGLPPQGSATPSPPSFRPTSLDEGPVAGSLNPRGIWPNNRVPMCRSHWLTF
jgi:uncharacterized protein YydD (DUF2326 family)